ncbi:unnamed protein product [Bursaphelenchus xylophilus]|uniref:(pine wood nematode) hypothetical protein n=1 Tax=Bursaphelenchus xylophilus TaxID=6326 RepID=A0A1I7RRB3_BURXY|nr:unnamed protein product [Bursaphelenchus xylophilus]CAG9130914.1 unnamed protein product [Bursaphelenchus xylophilus]
MIELRPLQITALVFAVLAFFLTFSAILTPAWQVVYAREIQQWIQSGLWLNCQTRPSGMYTCTYSFSEHDFDFYTNAETINLRTPPFYSWQRSLLAVYLIAQFITFLSFSSFFCSLNLQTRQLSAISFAVLISITFLIHSGTTLAFAVFTQMVEYRFYHVSVSGIYEKHWGYSFYIELFVLLFLFLSMCFAIAFLIQERMNKTNNNNYRLATANTADFYGLDPYETRLAMRELPNVPKYR